jgi:hypothetical protein
MLDIGFFIGGDVENVLIETVVLQDERETEQHRKRAHKVLRGVRRVQERQFKIVNKSRTSNNSIHINGGRQQP